MLTMKGILLRKKISINSIGGGWPNLAAYKRNVQRNNIARKQVYCNYFSNYGHSKHKGYKKLLESKRKSGVKKKVDLNDHINKKESQTLRQNRPQ